jgi:hypothetical protein
MTTNTTNTTDPQSTCAMLSNELRDEELALVSGGLGLMGEILSNVSKTRSEISMTFARNARA